MLLRRTRRPLNVFLNSRLVGRLNRYSSGMIDFQYDSDWLNWEHALPISISLPLREDRFRGDRVISVLDNLLPDSELVRRRVAERVGAGGYDAYSLLERVGHDCVGALQFLPEGQEAGTAGKVQGRLVGDEEIGVRLRNLAQEPLAADEELRISIAGAQEKTALLKWNGKWYIPQGATATTHIIKPQIGILRSQVDLRNSVENEHLCLSLASALGLNCANAKIESFDGVRALVVERFDRRWAKDGRLLRLPQEDCCQALSVSPVRKYNKDGGPGILEILGLLNGSDVPDLDRRTFIKAQIVFWLIGATDGHAKNFSIFINPGARFNLTPLYDVLSAQPAVNAGQIRWRQFRIAMAVGNQRRYRIDKISPRHFVQTAKRGGVSPAVVEEICAELAAQAETAVDATLSSLPVEFPRELAETVTNGLLDRVVSIEQFLA